MADGIIGLNKAINEFDLNRKSIFYEFAEKAIRWSISRSDLINSLIVIKPHYKKKINELKVKMQEYQSSRDIFADICKDLDISKSQLVRMMSVLKLQHPDSIIDDFDYQQSENDDAHDLAHYDSDDWMDRSDVNTLLSTLSSLQACIARLYYGLEDNDVAPMSFEQIGEVFEISRESVRDRFHKAMQKLKQRI